MGNPVINLARTNVTTPSANYLSVRFVFLNGRAAVWQENKKLGTATRVLYASDAELIKPNTARQPMQIVTSGETWEIRQQSTGCGCGAPTKRIPITQLVDPDYTQVG